MRILLLLLLVPGIYQTGHTQTITDITGQAIPASTLSGKKILVIILPQQPDTAFAGELFHFQQQYADSARVIGLVYPDADTAVQMQLALTYAQCINAGAILCTSITDAGDTERMAVLKWLSDKNRNRAAQPALPGSKYFISRRGRLYAELGAHTSLNAAMTTNLLKTRVPGEQ